VHFLAVQRVLGTLLMLLSLNMLLPLGLALWYQDGQALHFFVSMIFVLGVGLLIWLPSYGVRPELRTRDGFMVVTLFWIALSALSSLPFVLGPHLSFTDAVFESVSAFTTTGATVMTGLDSMPPSVLFYRQLLQWLGGMGVIVLAVAILPMLGVGGMQLYRAETPGPMKDDKLTPRITQSARALWLIYLALTLAAALGYWLAGMSPFDAISHALSTLSTGGFSTHDASLAYFDSLAIEVVAEVFMLLAAINFSVHFLALVHRDPRIYLGDVEARSFLVLVAVAVGVVAVTLWITGYYPGFGRALRESAFQVISVITSTGYTTADFSLWPLFLPVALIFVSFVGGCAGSTAGGMKVVRFLLLYKQAAQHVRQLIHSRALLPVKLGRRVVSDKVAAAVWGFFGVYIFTFALIMIIVLGTGADPVTAFAAVAASINNLGPGLGDVSANFASLSPVAKWALAAAMLLGRLEIFTVIVLLSPAYWRA